MACAFVGVDGCGEGCCVGEFECDVTFPFWFEWCDVDDDAASGVGGLADADYQDVSWDAEIFDGSCECETIGWDDAGGPGSVDEAFAYEFFGVDGDGVDVGENFEFI